jgi:hypothetical protein
MLVGKTKGKRQLGRPRRRWKDTIKIYLKEIGFKDMDRIYSYQYYDRAQQWSF